MPRDEDWLISVTELKMLGLPPYVLVTNRWEHRLAMEALAPEYTEFIALVPQLLGAQKKKEFANLTPKTKRRSFIWLVKEFLRTPADVRGTGSQKIDMGNRVARYSKLVDDMRIHRKFLRSKERRPVAQGG